MRHTFQSILDEGLPLHKIQTTVEPTLKTQSLEVVETREFTHQPTKTLWHVDLTSVLLAHNTFQQFWNVSKQTLYEYVTRCF